MQRQVFVMASGDSVSAWDLKFSEFSQHQETFPLLIEEPPGRYRRGTLRCKIESAKVSFCTCKDSIKVGQEGQLSTEKDEFFEVTIIAVEACNEEIQVSGHASRKVSFERDH